MAVMELWRRRDLEGTVKTEYIDGNFFTLDNAGNLVGVECFQDGAEATLSGSVTGYCILPSGETVSVAGTRSGNKASIKVPQSALAYTGPLGIVLKLVDDTTITTLLSIIVVVYRSETDTVITPSSQIITDWSNQIAAALQEVEDASASQDAKIDDLKSAFSTATDMTVISNWNTNYAYIAPSTVSDILPNQATATNNFNCTAIPCTEGDIFHITGTGGSGAKLWIWIESDGSIIDRAASNAEENNKKIIAPAGSAYLLVSVDATKAYMVVAGDPLYPKAGKTEVAGNLVFVNDNETDYFDGVECSGQYATCMNMDYAIIKDQSSAKRHGITFINDRRGFIEFSGVHNDTSTIILFWDGAGFTEVRANAKPFIKSDGNDMVFALKFNNDTVIDDETKISLRIFEVGTNDYVSITSQVYDRIRDTMIEVNTEEIHSRFVPQAGKEYSLALEIDFNTTDLGLNVDMGKTYVAVLFGSAGDDMYRRYSKFNDDIVCYKKTMLMTDLENSIRAKYCKNEIGENYAVFRTIASEKRACCNLITDYQNKNSILFDLSDATANDDVIGLITDKHVKAIVISHMHYDHVGMNPTGAIYSDGSFFARLRTVIDDDCIVYVQHKPPLAEDVPQSWRDMWQSTVDLLTAANIPVMEVPTDNYRVKIGEFTLTFVNVDISSYNSTSYGGYNATSLCTFVDYYDNTAFITGDIYPTTQDRLYDVSMLKRADILLAPHHGLNSKISYRFMSQLNPKVIVMNWGTSKNTAINSYTVTRGYSSAIRVWSEQYKIPVFDTYENETFDILMYPDGTVWYRKLKTYENTGIVRHYSNVRDALQLEIPDDAMSDDSTSANMTLNELLSKMPRNSTLDCLMYGSYGVVADMFGRNESQVSLIPANVLVAVHIDKMVGGNSNDIFNRGYVVEWTDAMDANFAYHVNAITMQSEPNQYEAVGRYRSNQETEEEKWQERYYVHVPVIT